MSEGPYELPEGWRWVRLGEVVTFERRAKKPTDLPPELPFVGMEHVEPDTGIVDIANCPPVSSVTSQVYLYNQNHVLYGKLRPYLNKVYLPKEEGACSAEFVPLRPNPSYVDRHFLAWYLRSSGFVSYANAHTTGARQPRVDLRALVAASLPLPPLSEQRRIVARIEELMGRIREARRLREEARQDTERLWQAVLAETFPRPGSELPEGWRWVRLGEIVLNIQPGFAFGKKKTVNGDLLHVRPFNIGIDGELDLAQKVYISSTGVEEGLVQLEPGDVLFNNTNSVELVGKTALVRESLKAAWSNHVTRLRTDTSKCEPGWLAFSLRVLWLQGFFARNCNKWIGQAGFNTDALKATEIPLPPLSEQGRIVAHLEAVQARIQALKEEQAATQAELKRLEQAILEKAFRGEL